jgi:hypothetical protein
VAGGGLSGTYAAIRLKQIFEDVNIITLHNIGNVAPFMHLRAEPKNKALLKAFDISNTDYERWKLGYEWQGKIYKQSNSTMNKGYMMKCYGEYNPDNVPFYETDYLAYKVPFVKVLRAAEEKTRHMTIIGRIKKVDIKNKSVIVNDETTAYPIHYDLLINTIALPDFVEMCTGNTIPLVAKPLYIYESDKKIGDYGTLHVMDETSPITRYHREANGGDRVFEETLTPSSTKISTAYFKYGKILYDSSTSAYRKLALSFFEILDIWMIGRFAVWRTHYDTEQAISDLEKYLQRDIFVPWKSIS